MVRPLILDIVICGRSSPAQVDMEMAVMAAPTVATVERAPVTIMAVAGTVSTKAALWLIAC